MQNQEKLISLLNDLITVNNDRTQGYEKAAKEVKDLALKGLFDAMAKDSRAFASELAIKVAQLGGIVKEGTSTAGNLYKVWMSIQTTLTGHDRKAILNSCEEGENVAQATYDYVLKADVVVSDDLHKLITDQKYKLLEGRDSMKHLRENVYA